MAKILIVSANLRDWNKNSGGKERTANLIEALSDHQITFLSFSWDTQSFEKQVSSNIYQIQPGISSTALNHYKKLIKGIAKTNYDACFELLKEDLLPFTKKVKELSKQSDLIIVDHMSISPLVYDIGEIPIIYNSHNCEYDMAKQLYPDNIKIVELVNKIEKRIIKNSVITTYCSKKDIARMEEYYGKIGKSFYIPNGTDMQKYIEPKTRLRSRDIIFVGSGHPPNAEAAKKIVPLAKIMPQYNFIIIGNAGHALNGESYTNNIKVLGQVSEDVLHKYFSKSLAFINPMNTGSGTHLKMMKALSYGIPIITSKVGARGFDEDEINESMIIAESIDEIKKAIESLENKKLYIKLSENGFSHSKKYDWKKIKKDYADIVNNLISNKPLKISVNNKKEKVLIYSIIRNRANSMNRFYSQIKKFVKAMPEYEFYLSIYENDSNDGTKTEIFNKDWSFLKGISIVSENIDTEYYGSVKDAQRVENLAKARNKGIESGGFLNNSDYVLMIEGDVLYTTDDIKRLLDFKNIEPNFDIVSSISLRKNGTHYDWWATRTSAIFNKDKSEIEDDYQNKQYGKYYSTSNGLCLYRSKPFKEGVRHHWINKVTKEFDCEMVVLCQNFHSAGYKNIYILYTSQAHHI
jgi:glycosyltransferase involved in cell wall biosynthesis